MLEIYRKEKGFTKKEFAKKAKIPFSTYRAIENGNQTASEETVNKITSLLGIPRESLFYSSRYTVRDIKIDEIAQIEQQ